MSSSRGEPASLIALVFRYPFVMSDSCFSSALGLPCDRRRARAIQFAAALLLVACSGDETAETTSEPVLGVPNVIIVGLDTVRADHIGVYGSKEVRTPHLDAFARQSILFERCSSTSTYTLPSFASLFTGLLPYHHGAVGGPQPRLRAQARTLAELLRARGYTTHAFVAIDYLTSEFSMDRGFDEHESFLRGPVSTRSRLYQDQLVEFLDRPRDRPFLLFAHYFDSHSPYEPSPPFDRMYYQGDPESPEHAGLRLLFEQRTNHQSTRTHNYDWLRGITDIEFPVKQYAAGITNLADTLGMFFDALRASGLMDRSIVVVVADHGEHLTEHRALFYHRYPYEEVLHVPLLIRLPGGVEGGRRVVEDVSLVDVLPTLMELLGLPLEQPLDGLSLVGLIRGGKPLPERFLFSEFGGRPERWVKAVWDGRYRLLSFNLSGWAWMELYDRHEDPAELRNLVRVLPRERERLARVLDARFPPGSRIRPGEAGDVQELDPGVAARLRALGYAD